MARNNAARQVAVLGPHRNESKKNEGAIVPLTKPTKEVETIMNMFVADKTVESYINELVKLFFWLFNKDTEKYFHDWIVEELYKADKKDMELQGNKNRKHLRAAFKQSIRNTTKDMCPIVLETLDFNTFSHFVTTRKKDNGSILSKSAYRAMQSSLMYLHKRARYEVDEDFRRDMSLFNKGMKRKVVKDKIEAGVSLEEGKKKMNINVFKLMCSKFAESGTEDAMFAHLYLILEWNLMARSDNCKILRLAHLEWRHDSLVFFFGKTKVDQTGEASDSPWHVYSNPFEPHLCPVLTLAKYLLSNPDLVTSDARLFPGNDQYSRCVYY